MHRHDEVEHVLHRLQQVLPIVNLNIEFVFNGIVHQNASLDAEVVVLVVPVRLEGDGDTIPALRVDVAQTVAANLDDTLGHDMGLLVQVDVVLVRVVKRTHGTNVRDLLQTHLLGHLLVNLKHHFLYLFIYNNYNIISLL